MNPLISVIIPVYNIKRFLPKCLDSVINQTYDNLEILVIDDGSTDGSAEICDLYSNRDKRISVFHKENSGVSDSRNLGVKKSKGEYFCFVDGDDFVNENYILEMFNLQKRYNVDISMCNYVYKWQDGKEKLTRNVEYNENHIFLDSGKNALKNMLYGKNYAPSCYCKLFKKTQNLSVYFENYKTGEDALSSSLYYPMSKNVAMINKPLYYYVQNEESVMHTENVDKIYDNVLTADLIYKNCERISPEIKKAAAYYLVEKNLIVFMKLYRKNDSSDKINHIMENVKKFRKIVISDKNAVKRTRLACILSYLGFDALYDIRNAVSSL